MGRLNKYLVKIFFNSFFILFSVLFIISSMVLLLTISNMTVLLKISVSEFFYLYALSLPEIVFFSLPLTFFITASLSISRLFDNSELLSILSFGISPKKILKPFLIISFFFTFLLLIITLFSIPTSNILYKNFINIKKTQSEFNFLTSSIGQKFGNWNAFIKTKSRDEYEDIVLYNNKKNILITAKSATTSRKENYFILSLQKGNIYLSTENHSNMIKFQQLNINQKAPVTDLTLNSIKKYIQTNTQKINKYLLISLFPMISFLFIYSISFFHNRYEKNHSVIYAISISVLYYLLVFSLYKKLYAILIILPMFFIFSKFLEKKKKVQF